MHLNSAAAPPFTNSTHALNSAAASAVYQLNPRINGAHKLHSLSRFQSLQPAKNTAEQPLQPVKKNTAAEQIGDHG